MLGKSTIDSHNQVCMNGSTALECDGPAFEVVFHDPACNLNRNSRSNSMSVDNLMHLRSMEHNIRRAVPFLEIRGNLSLSQNSPVLPVGEIRALGEGGLREHFWSKAPFEKQLHRVGSHLDTSANPGEPRCGFIDGDWVAAPCEGKASR